MSLQIQHFVELSEWIWIEMNVIESIIGNNHTN